ncbi:MAG: sulfatase-like hydrolase/transferase [Planctomycetota bacterium]
MPDAPNVVVIMSDMHRADSLGCYGNAIVRTPNLDGLARDGVRFENAFAQAASCVPSRVRW